MKINSNRKPHSMQRGGRSYAPQKDQVIESLGPAGKIRGNLGQIAEKYLSLAKEAQGQRDFIEAENYFQHAEHYRRLLERTKQNKRDAPKEPEGKEIEPSQAHATKAETDKTNASLPNELSESHPPHTRTNAEAVHREAKHTRLSTQKTPHSYGALTEGEEGKKGTNEKREAQEASLEELPTFITTEKAQGDSDQKINTHSTREAKETKKEATKKRSLLRIKKTPRTQKTPEVIAKDLDTNPKDT